MPNMPQDDWSDFAKEAGPDTRQPDMVSAAKADRHGWLPIESAPTDQEVLLAYSRRGQRVVQSATLEEFHGRGIWSWCVHDGKYGPYPIRGYMKDGLLGWQPLPAPPEDAE